MAERRVVHPEIITDLPDHDLSRVEAHSYREIDPLADAQRIRVTPQGVAQAQCGVTSPLRVVFVRDRGTEQRHDAVTAILVDRALEAVNALGQDFEEPIHDAMPLLWVELGGELRRSLDVDEQHRHLLSLAFEGAARREDLLGEVLRGVGTRIRRLDSGWGLLSDAVAARVAEAILP